MDRIPVIIDTDPGMDDTMAIILLAGSGRTDIRAITTTHGNVGLEGTTKNALGLRELLGLDCAVAKGAAKPMIVSLKEASSIHGKNGIGEYELPRPKKPVCEEAAWDLMYRLAKKENGELVLVTLGPLTNTAIAILKYPDFKKYIKRIYMMGGSRDFGNHSQNAEFNIWGDPHACSVVLESGIPVTMADLGFCKTCAVTGIEINEFIEGSKRLRGLLEAIKAQYGRLWATDKSFEEITMMLPDAVAAGAMLLDGDSLVTEDYYVMCETQSTVNEGQTVFDYKNYFKKSPNVQLAMSMDREKYKTMLAKAIASFE